MINVLTSIKKSNEITSEQVLSWAKSVEVQRAQKPILDITKESMEFDMTKKAKYICENAKRPKNTKQSNKKCTYCSKMHELHGCLAFEKDCKNVYAVTISRECAEVTADDQ